MSYATDADMVARFGAEDLIRLTDRRDPPLNMIDGEVLAAALADAAATIDAYLVQRYTLPLGSAPLLLRQLACDLAWFNLQRGAPTEDARRRHDDAIDHLRDIGRGLAGLGPDAANAVPSSRGGVSVSATPAVFTPATLADY